MRVVVLGARGMLGHVTVTVLREAGHEVIGVARSGPTDRVLDLEDRSATHAMLREAKPDWVVNAAGRLNRAVDAAMGPAIYVNSYMPHLLAGWGAEQGFRLLHVSTDCVFEGDRGAYRVEDVPDATSAYGRSKALGEVVNDRDLTIRTSIIGPELSGVGTGLMLWFLRQKERAPGWTKAIWTGLTTLELARVIDAIVSGRVLASGLWQCVPAQPISKCELLQLMNEAIRARPIAIDAVEGTAGDKSLINDRPELWPVPGYREMLHALRQWIDTRRSLYAGTPFAQ
jgi:dTDP-4-dehydrorhamnose reductase